MELTFLGIGSAYNTPWRNCNAYFHYGGALVLLDCGESAFAELMKRGLLSNCQKRIYVLLSHLHADHAGSLPSLCSYCYGRLRQKVRVVYPGREVEAYLRLAGIAEGEYERLPELGGALPGLWAEAAPTEHIPHYPSYGYLVGDGEQTIYFSGDSSGFPPAVLQKILRGDIAMAYQDVEWNEREKADACHLQYQRLLRLAPEERRGRVCCMHLNCDYRAVALRDGFRVADAEGLRPLNEKKTAIP